jgi:hypothetical protein
MNKEDEIVLNNLIEDIPSFKKHWLAYIEREIESEEDWEYESLYSVATEFSEYVVFLFENKEEKLLKQAFNKIEELTKHPDDSISNTAYVGFVEGILFKRNHKSISLDAFDRWLGENSKFFWYEMHDHFSGQK